MSVVLMKQCNKYFLLLLMTIMVHSPNVASAFAFGSFGRTEVATNQSPEIPKWDRVISLVQNNIPYYQACQRDSLVCSESALIAWQRFLQKISTGTAKKQIEEVNLFVNKVPYQDDLNNFGASDHWASPDEFFGNAGDCEDYVIAKYVSLRQLGIPVSSMKMVVLKDTARNIAHAVLAVKVREEVFVLDNVSNRLATPSELPHYEPYYAVNEEQQWLYHD